MVIGDAGWKGSSHRPAALGARSERRNSGWRGIAEARSRSLAMPSNLATGQAILASDESERAIFSSTLVEEEKIVFPQALPENREQTVQENMRIASFCTGASRLFACSASCE